MLSKFERLPADLKYKITTFLFNENFRNFTNTNHELHWLRHNHNRKRYFHKTQILYEPGDITSWSWIKNITILPDNQLAFCSYCQYIIYISKKNSESNYQCQQKLHAQGSRIHDLVVLADDELAATSENEVIYIWQKTLNLKYQFQQKVSAQKGIKRLLVLSNSDFACASPEHSIRIWEKSNNQYQLKQILEGPPPYSETLIELVNDEIAFTLDDKVIALQKDNAGHYSKQHTLITDHDRLSSSSSIILLTNGNIVIKRNLEIYIWKKGDKAQFQLKQKLSGFCNYVAYLAKLNNGQFVSATLNNIIYIWQANDKGIYHLKEKFIHKTILVSLAVSAQDELIFGLNDGRIMIHYPYPYPLLVNPNNTLIIKPQRTIPFDVKFENEQIGCRCSIM